MKVKDMKRKNQRLILIILLLGITLGYALLNATLTINGNSKITAQTWDIHWNNVQVTTGSVSIGTGDKAAVITPNDTTEVTYEVTLDMPGDFYEFTVDAVNGGTVDGMIDEVTSTYKIGNGEPTTITSNNLPDYLEYSVAYSDGTPITRYQELNANSTETYKVRVAYKSDIDVDDLPESNQSIIFSFSVEYVQADSNAVEVRVSPVSFADDEWDTIITAAQNGNTSAYTVGATKTVDLGTLGTHTLRVANNSTPAECATQGFSQTACGFVLEFADIITTHRMNPAYDNGTIGTGNVGGWPNSEMRTYVNSDIYNALPTALKNAIIDTTVVSGHGSTSGETNFTSTDKLYLLSYVEVYGSNNNYDTVKLTDTRQLDYYTGVPVTTSSYSGAIKQYNNSNYTWWLRSAISYNTPNFFSVNDNGYRGDPNAIGTYGVSPAFRLR